MTDKGRGVGVRADGCKFAACTVAVVAHASDITKTCHGWAATSPTSTDHATLGEQTYRDRSGRNPRKRSTRPILYYSESPGDSSPNIARLAVCWKTLCLLFNCRMRSNGHLMALALQVPLHRVSCTEYTLACVAFILIYR